MKTRTWIDSRHPSARHRAAESVMSVFLRALAAGFGRARQRRDLAALSDHFLRDIGLSRVDVEREISKPMWR